MTHLYLISILFIFSSCNIVKLVTGKDTKLDDNFLRKDLYIDLYKNNNFYGRKYFLDTEDVQNIYFDYYGASSAECSKDNGANWFDCRDGIISWVETEFFNTFKVRISSEERTYEESFSLSQFFPHGFFMLTCTQTVSANETIADFNMRQQANQVICIDDNVEIGSDTDGDSLNITSDSLIIFAKPYSGARITTSMSPVIDIMSTNSILVGVSVDAGVQNQVSISTAHGAEFESINVYSSLGSGITITAPATEQVNIYNSNISGMTAGIDSTNGMFSVYDSYVGSSTNAIKYNRDVAQNTSILIQKSYIENYAGILVATNAPGTMELTSSILGGSSTYNIYESKIFSHDGGPAIVVTDGIGGDEVNILDISNTKIIRGAVSSVDSAAIHFNVGSVNDSVVFDANSKVCNESNNVNSQFFEIVNSLNNQASFNPQNMEAHTSNDDIGICDNYDLEH